MEEKEPKETKNGGNSETPPGNRWWEQYAVRYFVGTVVGAVVLFVLREHSFLARKYASEMPTWTGWEIAALGAMGLAYCYVASAPVLTMHAIRGSFSLDKAPRFALLTSVILFLLALLFSCGVDKISDQGWIAWLLAASVTIPQVLFIHSAERDNFKEVHAFYKRLVKARKRDKDAREDFVESYRHLREHGNAMAIVIFEILLGLIIAKAQSASQLIVVLVFWSLPAAYCWIVGSVLEAKFAASSK